MAKNYNLGIFAGLILVGSLFFVGTLTGQTVYTLPHANTSPANPPRYGPEPVQAADRANAKPKKLAKNESDDLQAEKDFHDPSNDGMSASEEKAVLDAKGEDGFLPVPSPDSNQSDDPSSDAESNRLYNQESSRGKHRPSRANRTDVEHVEYYNPNTGTRDSYELEVERTGDGSILRVDFPNTGWLEIEGETIDNGDGTETYTTSRGYEYTITKPIRPSDDN